MDTAQIKQIISSTYPFLKETDIQQLLTIAKYRMLKNREVFIQAGQNSKKVFFILSGMTRAYFINQKGEEKNIFLRQEHTMSGAPDSLFQNKPTKYTFESILETKLLIFSFEKIQQLGEQFPNINKVHLAALHENIQTLLFRVESLIDKLPEERYEELLERSPQFFQTVFNKHIANYLGITPNSLSRIIKRKKEGR